MTNTPRAASGRTGCASLSSPCAIRSPLACNRKPTTTTRGTISMKLAMAIALTLLWASTTSAQWTVIDSTDDFTGEVSRSAASAPTEVQGLDYPATGGITVRCGKREKLIRLWIDGFYFRETLTGTTKEFATNADGKIEQWTGLITDMFDDGESSMLIANGPAPTKKFLAMLASANTLKVRVRNMLGYAAVLDINMEGAERAIERTFIGC